MVLPGCVKCGRRGSSLLRFAPPPRGAQPELAICTWCARSAADEGDDAYAYHCKTEAKALFRLGEPELDALRCAFTANPYDKRCARAERRRAARARACARG
jgi:hypothetical protein